MEYHDVQVAQAENEILTVRTGKVATLYFVALDELTTNVSAIFYHYKGEDHDRNHK